MEEEPKPKPRPIVRIGFLLISHSSLFSIGSCIAGFIALLLLPVLAKNTYISENALMPGSSSSMISSHDVTVANRLLKELSASSFMNPEEIGIERSRIISTYISELGADVSYHKFCPRLNQFSPMGFFSGPDAARVQANLNCSTYGVNTIGIIRAPRGDGKEAIVLVTPHNLESTIPGESISLSIGYVVFSLLSRVEWLAKDIIWLVADSKFGDYEPIHAWLAEYHTPGFSTLSSLSSSSCGTLQVSDDGRDTYRPISSNFLRAGTMAAALVVKTDVTNELPKDSVSIYAEASNGQMPNLDLINVVNFLAVYRQSMHISIEKFWPLLHSRWLVTIGEIIEFLGTVVRSLNPKWNFGIPVSEFVDGTATLASSMYRQALGIATGPHGSFRDFQVDAITLKINLGAYNIKARHNDLILRSSRLIEGVIRSINNLLEKFHQSFFLYLLTAPGKFVSVGVYMIAFAFMVAPLPLVAASLYMRAEKGSSDGKNNCSAVTFDGSWKWLNAAKEVFYVHKWGAFTLLLPYCVSRIPNLTSATSFAIWMLFSFSLLPLHWLLCHPYTAQANKGEWLILKSVTISAVFIGLLLMSIVNFAAAEIGALLIVPLCLIVRPLKIALLNPSLHSFLVILLNAVLLVAAFPPAALFIAKGALQGFPSLTIGDYWNWMECLWVWNSATYIYIGIVHIPCWVMCIRILFSTP